MFFSSLPSPSNCLVHFLRSFAHSVGISIGLHYWAPRHGKHICDGIVADGKRNISLRLRHLEPEARFDERLVWQAFAAVRNARVLLLPLPTPLPPVVRCAIRTFGSGISKYFAFDFDSDGRVLYGRSSGHAKEGSIVLPPLINVTP
jgi:hypothetical protein